jgi:hypothetical protein
MMHPIAQLGLLHPEMSPWQQCPAARQRWLQSGFAVPLPGASGGAAADSGGVTTAWTVCG